MTDKILLKGGTVISVDPTLGDFATGDVLIEGDRIAAVAASIDVSDAEVKDMTGKVVLPGFVDTHRHGWQGVTPQIGADYLLPEYFQVAMGMLGPNYSAEDLRASNAHGRLEALYSGITTMLEWSHLLNSADHTDAAIDGLRAVPARSVFAYGGGSVHWGEVPANPNLLDAADARRVRTDHFADNSGLVTMSMGVRGPEFSTMDVTRHDFDLARELDLRLSVHVGDGPFGLMTPAVELLHEAGLLGPDITFVHCNTCEDTHFAMMAECGATASISPATEMLMGHGFPATGRLLAAGVRPSLSIDSVGTGPGDMFNEMRSTLSCERALQNEAALGRLDYTGVSEKLTSRDVLEFATIQGARTLGLEDQVGSLTPGKQADVIVLDLSTVSLNPTLNPVGSLVMSAAADNIELVYVGGNVVKDVTGFVGIDESKIVSEAHSAQRRITAAAGVPEYATDWDFETITGT
jgi:5-methylthioadenosine/S-adenosylhomocysteine deaminase